MEGVNNPPNSHGSGILINNEPIFFNSLSRINNGNDDIVHGALDLIDSSSKVDTLKLNIVNADLTRGSDSRCLILENGLKLDNGNVIRLNMEDLNKLGLQLSLDNDDTENAFTKIISSFNDKYLITSVPHQKDNFLVETPINMDSEVSLDIPQAINLNSVGTVLDDNTFKNITFQQMEVISPFESEQVGCAVQINGDVNQISQQQDLSLLMSSPLVSDTRGTITLSDLLNSKGPEEMVPKENRKTQVFVINNSQKELKPKPVKPQIPTKQMPSIEVDNSKLPRYFVTPSKGQSLLVKNRKVPMKLKAQDLNSNGVKSKCPCFVNKTGPNGRSLLTSSIIAKDCASHKSLLNEKATHGEVKKETKTFKISPSSTSSLQRIDPEPTVVKTVSSSTYPKKDQVQNKQLKRLTPSQLKQIAAVLQKNRNNQGLIKTPSTLYDTETNTRIICRVVYPEDFENEKKVKKTPKPFIKSQEEKDDKSMENDTELVTLKSVARTRSGRLSRPPRRIVSSAEEKLISSQLSNKATESDQFQEITSTNIKDSKYRCSTCNKVFLGRRLAKHFVMNPTHCDEKTLKEIMETHGPDILSNGTAGANKSLKKKGVNWKKRMKLKNGANPPLKEVLSWYSEKELLDAFNEKIISNLSLWEILLLKVNHCTKNKVETLCEELLNLTQSVSEAAEGIFFSSSDQCSSYDYTLEDDCLSVIMKKPKGIYSCNDDYLINISNKLKRKAGGEDLGESKKSKVEVKEEEIKIIQDNLTNDKPEVPKITQDCDTKPPQLDLDLAESVDDLVNARLASLPDEIVPSLPSKALADDILRGILSDPPTSSGLYPLDKRVSSSTEDLIKSLENLSEMANQTSLGSSDLDFGVLSQDFTSNNFLS